MILFFLFLCLSIHLIGCNQGAKGSWSNIIQNAPQKPLHQIEAGIKTGCRNSENFCENGFKYSFAAPGAFKFILFLLLFGSKYKGKYIKD